MLERPRLQASIREGFRIVPIVTLLGPRQCGKSTIARLLFAVEGGSYFDLENPADAAALERPDLVLRDLRGLIVIDEIQRMSSLFPLLRVLADRDGRPAHFLLLGSASPALVKGASETLAGRTVFVDMEGFTLDETGSGEWKRLWLRGGFPLSFLAESDEESLAWRRGFVRAFLERDVPQLGLSIPGAAIGRFWTMTAHYNGRIWNKAELARALGSSEHTVSRYLDLLAGAFVVRVLQPWYENTGKRLVKAPKVYLRDSGLLHCLLGLGTEEALWSHPAVGSSWEGLVLAQVAERLPDAKLYFYATHGGAELDLVVLRGGRRWGVEMKLSQAPIFTRSMGVALADLGLERIYTVYPGSRRYSIHEKAEALPLAELDTKLFE
jgi:hypothetical protein